MASLDDSNQLSRNQEWGCANMGVNQMNQLSIVTRLVFLVVAKQSRLTHSQPTTEWLISCRWHFKIHFLKSGLLLFDSTLLQVMAWCRQATSHYLSKCWLKFHWSFYLRALLTVKCFWQFMPEKMHGITETLKVSIGNIFIIYICEAPFKTCVRVPTWKILLFHIFHCTGSEGSCMM